MSRVPYLRVVATVVPVCMIVGCRSSNGLGTKAERMLEAAVFGTPDGVRDFRRHLAKLSDADDEARRRAISEALYIAKDERATAQQRAAVLREAAILVGDDDLGRIEPLLDDADLGEAALFAIERVPGERASKVLMRTFMAADHGGGDHPPTVSAEAVLAAIGRRDIDAVSRNVLRDCAAQPKWERIARHALAREGDPASETILSSALEGGRPGAVADWLLWLDASASLMAADKSRELWRATAVHPDPMLRRVAFARDVSSGDAVSVAMERLGDPDPRISARVHQALLGSEADRVRDRLVSIAMGEVDVVASSGDRAASARRARAAAIRVLIEREDEDRGRIVDTALESDAETKNAVLAALAEAPRDRDRSQYMDLLASEDPELREVGAKGLLALATADSADAEARDRAREAVGAVLGAGVGVDARIAAWSVLAKVPDESAVTLVRSPAVQPVDARERAAIDAAKLAVAGSLDNRAEAQALAKEVLDGAKNRGQRQRAAKILVAAGGDIASIARELGCLTSWHIAGPFRGPDEKTFTKLPFATTGIDPSVPLRLATADGARELPWVAKVSDDIDGVIDLRFVSNEGNVSAVAYTVLQCPGAMNAELRVGSDDQIAVWLDGKLVHENFVARGLNVDEDRVAIDLDAGRHELLIEIGQNGGGWEFHARVVPR